MLLTIAATDNGCLLSWATSFALPEEHLLKKNTLLTTLDTLTKEWKVSFEFKPSSFTNKAWAQVLQLTIGGKSGNIGDRTPALWIHPKSKGVYVVTTLNGKANVAKHFPKMKPPLHTWTPVELSQAKRGSKFMFSLIMQGKTVWTVENTEPREFSDVKVFASSRWNVAQAGSIRGFKIENMMPGKSKLSYVELYMILFSFDSTME